MGGDQAQMFRGLYAYGKTYCDQTLLVTKLGEGMFLWRPPCPNPKVLGPAPPISGYIYIPQCVSENGQVSLDDHFR